jgi:ATP synthase protein I
MSNPDESRDEALQRLNARAKALEARQAQKVSHDAAAAKVSGYGYRLIGVLIGGVFVGLAFGAIADAVLRSQPWGMIVGVLVGFGVSIWMAVRSAQQMSAEVAREYGPPRDLPPDDEDED